MKSVVWTLCILFCVIFNGAYSGRSSGGGRSRGSSHSWSWSRPSSSISKPSYSSSKPSHSVARPSPSYSKPKPSAPELPVHHASSNRQPIGWNTNIGKPNPSYPSSSGLSGNIVHQKNAGAGLNSHPQGPPIFGSPSYPASSGLSGSLSRQPSSSGSHAYPPSSGLSGGTNYPQGPSGSHLYPPSSGLSGSGSGYKPYVPSNVPSYPVSGGLSGAGVGHAAFGGSNVKPVNNAPVYNGYNPSAHGGYIPPVNPPSYSVHSPNIHHSNPPAYSHFPPSPPSPPAYGGFHPSPPAYGGFHQSPPAYSAYNPPPYLSGYHPGLGGGYNPTYISHSNSGSTLTNLLTGLSIWNLARSASHHHDYRDRNYDSYDRPVHHHHYHSRHNPTQKTNNSSVVPANELSNCTLTLLTSNGRDVIGIPCEIATSFAPNANISNASTQPSVENSKGDTCIIRVVRKGVSEETKISCEFLNNLYGNATQPLPGKLNCTSSNPMDIYDPIVPPCRMVANETDEGLFKVIPLSQITPSPNLEVIPITISPLTLNTTAATVSDMPSNSSELYSSSSAVTTLSQENGNYSSTSAPVINP